MTVSPRSPLLNPALARPDWQLSVPRSPRQLWLDKNENLDPAMLALSQGILRDIDPINVATYPDCGELYRKLARWVGVSPDYLLLTPGSDGAIRLTFEAFVSEGDTVVHTSPTFAMYSVYCQMFGAKVEAVGYERGVQGPRLDVDQLLSRVQKVKPRLFCLPNPDSPTGTVISPEELKAVVEQCSRTDTMVLIDEAYHPFYEGTCVPLTKEYPNLVVARTFAKAWGLAGLRVGYAVAHPGTMRYIDKLRPMYEVSTVSVAVVERMLDHVPDVMASVQRLNQGKRFFVDAMRRLGFDTLLTEGNFCHVAFGPHAGRIHDALEELVIYRRDFKEPCLKGYSRFSATTAERFAPVIEAIRTTVEGATA